MTSIGSYTKQIPLNNGYFRAIQTFVGAANISTTMYTPSGTLSDGRVSTMVLAQVAGLTDANPVSYTHLTLPTKRIV